ncbi:DUF2282 domain-containing protein [Paraburkholderia sp. SIMBA_049]
MARAGKKDCGNPRHARAGRSPHDAACDEGLLLPAGTCATIDGSAFKATE